MSESRIKDYMKILAQIAIIKKSIDKIDEEVLELMSLNCEMDSDALIEILTQLNTEGGIK